MKKIFLLFCIITVVASTSCEEDELKLPAEVNIAFDMYSFNLGDDAKGDPVFTVDEGYLVINTIEFDGDREQGDDYFFSSTFKELLQAEMHTGKINQDVSFDIPQGEYNMIELNLILGDGVNPALLLKGSFQKGPFENVPVLFEYSFQEEVRLRAVNKAGNRQIILRKDAPCTATILLNAPFMFQFLNMGLIRNADYYIIAEEETIIINNQKNTDIFNLLATRLDKSLQVIFE